jgi:hypothetical protein
LTRGLFAVQARQSKGASTAGCSARPRRRLRDARRGARDRRWRFGRGSTFLCRAAPAEQVGRSAGRRRGLRDVRRSARDHRRRFDRRLFCVRRVGGGCSRSCPRSLLRVTSRAASCGCAITSAFDTGIGNVSAGVCAIVGQLMALLFSPLATAHASASRPAVSQCIIAAPTHRVEVVVVLSSSSCSRRPVVVVLSSSSCRRRPVVVVLSSSSCRRRPVVVVLSSSSAMSPAKSASTMS